MEIGQRIKQLRVLRRMSQGEVEKRTGLLRCYTSRVENGYTVPAIETLQKYAKAFELPLYQLFVEDNTKADVIPAKDGPALSSQQKFLLRQLALILPKIDVRDGKLLIATAKQMARRK